MNSQSNKKTDIITIDSDSGKENDIQIVNRTIKSKAINKTNSTVFESIEDKENSDSWSKSTQDQQTSKSTAKKYLNMITLCSSSTPEYSCDW